MKRYKKRSRDAGVESYEYGEDWITLRFARGGVYKYSSDHVGKANIDKMKELADAGSGLTTFVNTHPEVKNGYSCSKASETQ